jgi:hypothetical protein
MGSYIGVWKGAARRTGAADVHAYLARRDAGEKWCRGCRAWHDRAVFGVDRSRSDGLAPLCRDAKNRRERALYARRPAPPGRYGVAGAAPIGVAVPGSHSSRQIT